MQIYCQYLCIFWCIWIHLCVCRYILVYCIYLYTHYADI